MSKEIQINNNNFTDEVLNSKLPVLIDFWAPWCGPCRMVAPILEEISIEFENKLKVCKCNVDENSDISSKYNINSIPTFILFINGKEESRSIGALSKEGLIKVFKEKI